MHETRGHSGIGVAAIVLACSSTRPGRPTQDVVVRDEMQLEHAERIARAVSDEVIVVTDRINPEAKEGIASSIRAGVRLASNGARILITRCDQPLITADHLRALITVDAPIVATGYAGIAGTPAVFAPELVPHLLSLRGDQEARAVIESRRDIAVIIPFERTAVSAESG